MREIKFRAWDKVGKQMGEVETIEFKEQIIWFRWYKSKIRQGYYKIPISDIEFIQFTGFHDKTGREIYEGDIVIYYNPIIGERYEDRFKHKTEVSMFNLRTLGLENRLRLEIIGNIYEHSYLLGNEYESS